MDTSGQSAQAALAAVLEERAAVFAEVVMHGWRHAGVEGLVLTDGTWWTPTAATRYTTATTLSAALNELRYYPHGTYVEGYLLTDHDEAEAASWLGHHGQVLFGRRGRAYLGVPLATSWVTSYSKRHGISGVLHSQKTAGYDLIAHGLPPEAHASPR
jgi:hypothetical protein